MANCGKMRMNVNTWKGDSAYEVAVENGFEGTEAEWLASLKGADGRTTSVNGVEQADGNVTITGDDIAVSATDKRKVSEVAAAFDLLNGVFGIGEDSIDLKGKYLDNALFR